MQKISFDSPDDAKYLIERNTWRVYCIFFLVKHYWVLLINVVHPLTLNDNRLWGISIYSVYRRTATPKLSTTNYNWTYKLDRLRWGETLLITLITAYLDMYHKKYRKFLYIYFAQLRPLKENTNGIISNDFCITIYTYRGTVVEGCSRKSKSLGEGATIKTGRGGYRKIYNKDTWLRFRG